MSQLHVETRRTCLAYSPGGHRAELERATQGILFQDAFHVTFDDGRPASVPRSHRLYHVTHPRRSIWRTLANALEALVILLRERPALVISTGADVATPVILLARLMGTSVVFIETGGSLEPTLTGRLVYPFCDLFLVQWEEKKRAFPRAVLCNGLLL